MLYMKSTITMQVVLASKSFTGTMLISFQLNCTGCQAQTSAHTNLPFCRNAYNMVINKFGDQLYNGLEETIVKHLQLIEKKVEAAQGESFLRELKLRWDHHNKSMQMIRDILMVRASFMLTLSDPRLQKKCAWKAFSRFALADNALLHAVHGSHICQAPEQGACASAGP